MGMMADKSSHRADASETPEGDQISRLKDYLDGKPIKGSLPHEEDCLRAEMSSAAASNPKLTALLVEYGMDVIVANAVKKIPPTQNITNAGDFIYVVAAVHLLPALAPVLEEFAKHAEFISPKRADDFRTLCKQVAKEIRDKKSA